MNRVLKKSMRIPRFGFTIEKQQKTVGRDVAFEVLTPARQRKSTLAVFENDNVVITKHVIVCPWCGKKAPAYHNNQMEPHQLIDMWLAQQTSMFEKLPKTLLFNRPIEAMEKFVCPRCNMISHPSKGFIDVLFIVDRKTIKIFRKLELKELFQIKWGADKICITNFELYEAITFNLKNGHTYVSLEDGRGEKLKVHDISNTKANLYSDDPIFELINLYKPVNRELKNQFAKIFRGPLPFRTKELTVEQFLLMTEFIGYDSAFYSALPYADKGDLIERRFLKSAKRLHDAQKVPNIFEKTILPKVKSIRKIFFCNPALFFYTGELEQLWKIIEDINLFRNFITSKNIFSELAFLCKMPHLIDFYTEYKAEIGIKKLYHNFFQATNRYWLYNYVSWYYLLSEYDRKVERQKWHDGWLEKRDDFEGIENDMGARFSVSIPDRSSKDFRHPGLECCINGYSFRRLKNSMEFLQAGNELKNCLTGWQFFRNNVYGMIDNGKYVAAVEIKDNVIIQAHTYRNGDISGNHSIKQAFDIWKNRNLITERKEFN
jgi:hypothetical protein